MEKYERYEPTIIIPQPTTPEIIIIHSPTSLTVLNKNYERIVEISAMCEEDIP